MSRGLECESYGNRFQMGVEEDGKVKSKMKDGCLHRAVYPLYTSRCFGRATSTCTKALVLPSLVL